MSAFTSTGLAKPAAAVLALAAGWVVLSAAPAQEEGGDARVKELELLVETLEKQNRQLQDQLAAKAPTGNASLEEALAAANKEASEYKVLYRELLLRMEQLGLETVRSDKALQERLINAVSEHQLYKDRNDKAYEQLLKLSEAVLEYLKSSSDPEARGRLEAELRAADELIGTGVIKKHEARLVDLNNGKVISYKDEYKLAVLDIGLRSGVRIGMPVNIYRKDRLIGTALVVDVRENLSGAVVDKIFTDGDNVRPQDSVRPRTTSGIDL